MPMSRIEFEGIRSRHGSLAGNATAMSKIATHNVTAYKLISQDIPFLICEILELQAEAKEFYCGAEPPGLDP